MEATGDKNGKRVERGRGRPPHTELTRAQEFAIDALAGGATIRDAARAAGVSRRSVSRWMAQPLFARAYDERVRQLRIELQNKMLAERDAAWERMLLRMRGDDERISLRADTWFLDRLLSKTIQLAPADGLVSPVPLPEIAAAFLAEEDDDEEGGVQ